MHITSDAITPDAITPEAITQSDFERHFENKTQKARQEIKLFLRVVSLLVD